MGRASGLSALPTKGRTHFTGSARPRSKYDHFCSEKIGMETWVLVYDEHYRKYCDKRCCPHDLDSFQWFLRDIGTPSLSFQKPHQHIVQTAVSYRQVPLGTCIRLRGPEDYTSVVHKNLYPELREKQDKSRRSSSCTIM